MSLYEKTAEKATIQQDIHQSSFNRRYLYNDNGNTGNDNNNYNNYPGARACTRVREEMGEMRELYSLYMDAFGRDRVAAIVRREMAQAIEAGADQSLITYAIELAEIAPQPSWAYARAVIRRCMSDGCRTYEDCVRRAERVYAPKPRREETKKAACAERDITDADFEHGFYVDPMAREVRRNG